MAKRTKRTLKNKGRKKAVRKSAAKRAAPKRKATKKIAKRAVKRRGAAKTKQARVRKQKQKENLGLEVATVETTIVDIIEEPVPGVITITEFESTRMPESNEEDGD